MKPTIITLICVSLVTACGPSSSPEGRMGMKIDNLQRTLDSMTAMQKQIDSLKSQNVMILDSLANISRQLQRLKR